MPLTVELPNWLPYKDRKKKRKKEIIQRTEQNGKKRNNNKKLCNGVAMAVK